MRPSLPHPLADRRRPARPRPRRLAMLAYRRASGRHAPPAQGGAPAAVTPEPREPIGDLPPGHDFAVRRVREAGGPLDEASYTCDCGCVFCASVSTSVTCPHCGAEQSW